MVAIILPSGRKPRKPILMSRLILTLKKMARTAATIWPNTVAAAAPATPISGKPNRPKIMIGSKMILRMAPVPWVNMVYMVRPVDWSSFSKVI